MTHFGTPFLRGFGQTRNNRSRLSDDFERDRKKGVQKGVPKMTHFGVPQPVGGRDPGGSGSRGVEIPGGSGPPRDGGRDPKMDHFGTPFWRGPERYRIS